MQEKTTYLNALRERERPRELAEPALADGVALLVALGGKGGLASDGQDVVLDVELDVLLREARELERGRHEVLLLVFVQVHPVAHISRQHRVLLSILGRCRGNLPWTQRAHRLVGVAPVSRRDRGRARGARARVEGLVEEPVEVGERVERLSEERRKRHLES